MSVLCSLKRAPVAARVIPVPADTTAGRLISLRSPAPALRFGIILRTHVLLPMLRTAPRSHCFVQPLRVDAELPPQRLLNFVLFIYFCRQGTYASSGASVCSDCSAGRFTSLSVQSACTACAVGRYAGAVEASSCTACASGTVINRRCLPWAVFIPRFFSSLMCYFRPSCRVVLQFGPSTGSAACDACPAGSFCASAALAAVSGSCAKGSYSSAGNRAPPAV